MNPKLLLVMTIAGIATILTVAASPALATASSTQQRSQFSQRSPSQHYASSSNPSDALILPQAKSESYSTANSKESLLLSKRNGKPRKPGCPTSGK